MTVQRVQTQISNTAATAAGHVLRAWWADPEAATGPDVVKAWEVIHDYRALHQYPLVLVTNGLRDLVRRHTDDGGTVSQRYKRVPRMLDKLLRYPKMRLAQMEDIGGCRAIVAGDTAMKRVRARIRNNWEVVREYPYDVEAKTKTGYRSRHIVVRRNNRLIEIQLRTPRQHDWAEAVEDAAARTGHNLKDGDGPLELIDFFRVASRIIALQERGDWPDNEESAALRVRWDELNQHVRQYFPESAG